MTDYARLDALTSSVLEETSKLNYSKGTIGSFRRLFAFFARYAPTRCRHGSTEALAVGLYWLG